MTDLSNTPDPDQERIETEERRRGLLTLEICFLAVIGVLVLLAFFEALSYAIVSARTPFVIMVPLFALIVMQALRLARYRREADFTAQIRMTLTGHFRHVNKILALCAWMVVLMLLIAVLGHYIGIALFGLILMWWVANERFVLALVVIAVTTVCIFVVFEYGFNVELYRGLFFRYLMGYRDF